MKTVFVGGSRRISRLGSDLRGRRSTFKSPAQLEKLLLGCPADIRDRIDRYISEHAQEYAHPALFQL